ncbi:MAG: hypothetical protein ABI429_00805 [Jatrophihabitantaceae bacterium]
MIEQTARAVVDGLRAAGTDAHLAETGVYRFGVRIALGDGREALWSAGGTAGLEAEVLRDGDLVGYLSELPGSDDFTVAQIVDAIRAADYSQPAAVEHAPPPPPAAALPVEGGLFRRFTDGFRHPN